MEALYDRGRHAATWSGAELAPKMLRRCVEMEAMYLGTDEQHRVAADKVPDMVEKGARGVQQVYQQHDHRLLFSHTRQLRLELFWSHQALPGSSIRSKLFDFVVKSKQ